MKSVNPYTGQMIQEYRPMKSQEVEEILQELHEGFQSWKKTSFEHRSTLLKKLSQNLRQKKEEFALEITQEMGKPIQESRAEIEKCADLCEYYAQNAQDFVKDQRIPTEFSKSYLTYQPLGVILAVMPWNFPYWQVFRFAAPALMAGNVGVLKHASNVSGCALTIERIFHDAGFPKNVFRTILVPGSEVKRVIENPLVKAVTLTGSTPAGQSVAECAGRSIKKTVLELGGSDPYIVLEDADLDLAAQNCVKGRMINSGQSCIAAKRWIVVEKVVPTFEKKVLEILKEIKIGDPRQESTQCGPLARKDLRNELHEQVKKSMELGAQCLLGGKISEEDCFYPPTLLTRVKKGMPAYEEELFGPVASLISVKDEKEAIQVANQTSFGLGAAIFSRDLKKAERIAKEELEAGCCFVNHFVRSHQALPFGGVKESGYGRELSFLGIKEFMNAKTVVVQ